MRHSPNAVEDPSKNYSQLDKSQEVSLNITLMPGKCGQRKPGISGNGALSSDYASERRNICSVRTLPRAGPAMAVYEGVTCIAGYRADSRTIFLDMLPVPG
jgi:hypothetical protein